MIVIIKPNTVGDNMEAVVLNTGERLCGGFDIVETLEYVLSKEYPLIVIIQTK